MSQQNNIDPKVIDLHTLWLFHNGNNPTYIDPITKKAPAGYEHQCAINMSYAIQMAGVNMSSFKGSVAEVTIGGKRMRLARDIYQLAAWVRKVFDSASRRAGTPWLYENPNWKSDLSYSNESMVNNFWNRKGIVIIYDHWINESEQLRGHIDLWHLNEMRRAKKHYDYFAYAKSVYFMPLPWVILK